MEWKMKELPRSYSYSLLCNPKSERRRGVPLFLYSLFFTALPSSQHSPLPHSSAQHNTSPREGDLETM